MDEWTNERTNERKQRVNEWTTEQMNEWMGNENDADDEMTTNSWLFLKPPAREQTNKLPVAVGR